MRVARHDDCSLRVGLIAFTTAWTPLRQSTKTILCSKTSAAVRHSKPATPQCFVTASPDPMLSVQSYGCGSERQTTSSGVQNSPVWLLVTMTTSLWRCSWPLVANVYHISILDPPPVVVVLNPVQTVVSSIQEGTVADGRSLRVGLITLSTAWKS